MTQHPPIGVPRCYPGTELPVLYPGEMATAQVDPDAVHAALHGSGRDPITLTNWLVEPAPGPYAWYLRTRYRIFGRWCSRGQPNLTLTPIVTTVDRKESGR